MISIPGYLAIRTISGRNGPFNVGRLATSIGEFVIKDALLDQYMEGKYEGTFAIRQIRPSYYTHGGRLVVEIRAELESMSLDEVSDLSSEDAEQMTSTVPDPLEEETPPVTPANRPIAPVKQPAPRPISRQPPAEADNDNRPFGMDFPAPAVALQPSVDAELFSTIWPLGNEVKLDTTVDRQRLRQQCTRLAELGYELNFKTQTWHRQ
ncbi:DUF3275 family protein [Pseudomonas sp. 21LCFQ02]|uniref:DUF3275 family protein n=1 Tax=Pseudomonas sp. 21LCFQ02 TaxID=2957505 RepID=UPI00209AE9F1|nr:DUF3275 family protein [Pseudomonas sp. 21LCFQ02]MCO8166189.1 DUF3275 family protein [Pseudomonas sp. 21LCFQ02]